MKKLMVVLMLGLVGCGSGGGGGAGVAIPSSVESPSLSASDSSGNERAEMVINLIGSDPLGLDLTYSCKSGCPSGLSVNASTGVVKWTPSDSHVGFHDVEFAVANISKETTKMVRLTVNNVNRIPVFQSMSSQTIAEGQVATETPVATDEDGDSLTISLLSSVSNASFSGGVLTFSPDYSQSGSHSFVFEVTDGEATVQQTLSISVSNANRAPSLASISAKSVNETELLSFSAVGSDLDGNSISYSASGLSGAAINASTGAVTYTPACGKRGNYSLTISVSDGSLSSSQVVSVTVNSKACSTPQIEIPGFVKTHATREIIAYPDWQTGFTGYSFTSPVLVGASVGQSPFISAYDPTLYAVNPALGVTVNTFTGIEVVCFGGASYDPSWNSSTYKMTVSNASGGLGDHHSFLFSATNVDGVSTYMWVKIYRASGQWVTHKWHASTASIVPVEVCATGGSPTVINH